MFGKATFIPPAADRSTRSSLWWFNVQAVLRAVFDATCGGGTFVFTAFALSLGVSRDKMGRLAVAASAACVLQMLVLPWLARVGDRKRFVLRLGVLEPLLIIAAVLVVPFLPAWARLGALLAAVFASAAFVAMTQPITDDWLASTLPGGVRGRYLGRRFQFVAATVIVVLLVNGRAADAVGGNNTWGLAAIICAGALFGLAAIDALRRVRPDDMAPPVSVRLIDIPRVFHVPGFRRYAIALFVYMVPFLLGGPFYQVYALTVLNMRKSSVAAMLIIYNVIRMVLSRPAGVLLDRWGPRAVLVGSVPLYVGFFALLGLATPERSWLAYVAWALAGIGDGAWAPALQVALFGVIPPSGGRPAFFAVSNLLTVGLLAAGAVVAEPIIRSLRDAHLVLGPMKLDQYQIFYMLCAVLMLPSLAVSMLFIGKRSAKIIEEKPET